MLAHFLLDFGEGSTLAAAGATSDDYFVDWVLSSEARSFIFLFAFEAYLVELLLKSNHLFGRYGFSL